jgi:lipoprotein-anchoring transpeptidase ErfK/SrfK
MIAAAVATRSQRPAHNASVLSRRAFMVGLLSASASGCVSSLSERSSFGTTPELVPLQTHYGPLVDDQFSIPAVNLSAINERYYRQRVHFRTDERPGTIVVDTANFHLYLVEPGDIAIRYGVALGRAGFEWSGRAEIGSKQKWPTWTPPDEMIERQPELEKWSAINGSMPPGLDNPLGARALYIYQDDRDTLFRIHGTPDVATIGSAASSGCVRMINQDVVDLNDRVTEGTEIKVQEVEDRVLV